MSEINHRLSEDPAFRQGLERSTETYVAVRERLGRSQVKGPETPPAPARIATFPGGPPPAPPAGKGHPGGGPGRVKCLHAHVAHHLVTADNPVGEFALARIGWADPLQPCV